MSAGKRKACGKLPRPVGTSSSLSQLSLEPLDCIFSVNCVIYVCLQYFDTVGWVLRPVKNRRPYNLCCVGGELNPAQSINQSASPQRTVLVYVIMRQFTVNK